MRRGTKLKKSPVKRRRAVEKVSLDAGLGKRR